MNGTERQARWAEDIRQKALAEMDEFLGRKAGDPEWAARMDVAHATRDQIAGVAQAAWWIESRRMSGEGLLREHITGRHRAGAPVAFRGRCGHAGFTRTAPNQLTCTTCGHVAIETA